MDTPITPKLAPAQVLQHGIDLFQADRLAEAEALFRHVLAAEPTNAVALDMLGCIAHRTGRHQDALEFFHRALQRDPDDPFVHFNLGAALEEQGRQQEAAACYRRVLALRPAHLKAWNKLGSLLLAMGDLTGAAGHYRHALVIHADRPVLHHNLGVALHRLGRADEAADCLRRALQLAPGYLDALIHLGHLLRERGGNEEALHCFRRALALDPANASLHAVTGATLASLARYDEALASFRRALAMAPGLAAAHWNLALILLLCGELAEGLAHYEYRFEGAEEYRQALGHDVPEKLAAKPRWRGETLQGRSLLVWTEQGLGDSLMMMRYLPRLKERGAGRILVACQPALARVMQTLPAVSRAIGHGTPFDLDGIDLHCSMMSLPHLFGTRLETIPRAVPYLHVPPAMAGKWRDRLTALPGKKVGLAWAGSRTQRKDALRSIPFERLAPLLAVPGVQWISLQKERRAAHPALLDWMTECEDFLDTAALIQQLDLVISVDTAVVHLAGALAKPVWLLNRHESEWRWLLAREDSPWYPTLRIFRQPVPHDWDSVIAEAATALRPARSSPSV
jgi:tetratricopeptide (TPR) repeat protein